MNIIDIIQKNSLTVRCLPYKVTSKLSCPKNYNLQKNEVIEFWKPDLKYFSENNRWDNPQKIMDKFYSNWGEKGRPFIVKTRNVEKGGWWYVKETKDTNSTIRFNRKYDKFFASTLEEAIKLYLDSKK